MGDTSSAVDEFINSHDGWQRDNLVRFRALVHEAEPAATEQIKWSVPVFSTSGKMVCAMSTFTNHTKYNFFEGAQLSDEHGLFNSGLDSKQHRSINLAAGEEIDGGKLGDLLKQAFALVKTA
jgi:hypothetical protein